MYKVLRFSSIICVQSVKLQLQMSRTVNICIIKANVRKESPGMSHCYRSVVHVRRGDSRNRFSHWEKKKKKDLGRNVTPPTQSHVSSLHVLVLLLRARVSQLIKWCCLTKYPVVGM